jgi:hypothetical protein
MENAQHSTFNIQRPTRARRTWILSARCWAWNVFSPLALLVPLCLWAQVPPQIPPNLQMQLQVQQPTVDVTTPVTATASFDPPVVRVGEKTFYRANVEATESSIQWPEEISAPAELHFGANARGQITQFLGSNFRSLTTFLYEIRPAAAGRFTITNFTVNAFGQTVAVPAASLEVVADHPGSPPARQLVLECSATNVFSGQPFRARVLLPAGPANEIEALREIQLTGDGLMTDKTTIRQSIEVVNVNGQLRPAFVCELTVTPIAAGPLKFFAQGFTAGREFTGPISIRGQVSLPGGPAKYVLLVSDPLQLNVRPLPVEGELPGFTGAMGRFYHDPPWLAKDRLNVGEPVQLKLVFHGAGELTRFVPPAAPRSRDWQIIADPPPATSFTLIPLTDETTSTPAIPFSYFDPETAKYVDLTIPAIPVTVVGQGLPLSVRADDDGEKNSAPLKLSELAASPGKNVASLKPLQMQLWFVGVQLLPVAGFVALWQWDRRRRFLEAHPEIVRRRQARRDLRREKIQLEQAAVSGDAAAFVQHAANAMSIAVAPHYPANPRALVGGDVLAQLADAGRNGAAGETVKKVFAAADAQFAADKKIEAEWLALEPDVAAVLLQLEEKL